MPGSLSQQQSVAVSNAASTFVIGQNPKRKTITFLSPSANRITISFNGPAVLDQGPTVQPNTTKVQFTLKDDGEIIQRDIFAIAATAPTQLNFTEEFDW